jgi:hypothetical protein
LRDFGLEAGGVGDDLGCGADAGELGQVFGDFPHAAADAEAAR